VLRPQPTTAMVASVLAKTTPTYEPVTAAVAVAAVATLAAVGNRVQTAGYTIAQTTGHRVVDGRRMRRPTIPRLWATTVAQMQWTKARQDLCLRA
jgi:hypothetical protein